MSDWSLRDIIFNTNLTESEARMYMYYYNKFTRIAMNIYKWELPDELDESIIEQYLWEDGRALIWNHSTFGLVVTRCSESSWDINRRANRWKPYVDVINSNIELPNELTKEQCVCIYDLTNPLTIRRNCLAWLPDIVDNNETIRQQIWNQHTPMLAVIGDPQTKRKVQNAVNNIAKNNSLIYLEKETIDTLEVMDFKAPFNIDPLTSAMNVKINEALEYLGVDSQNGFDKKERKLVDEQESNDEILNYMLADGLKARKSAVDKMSKILGIKSSVKISETVRPIDKTEVSTNDNINNG